MVGLRLPIVTHPLQALVTEPLKPFLDPVLVSATLHVYVSQTDRGELVIGSEIDPYASYSNRSTLPFLESSASHVLELLPGRGRRQGAPPVGRDLRHDARTSAPSWVPCPTIGGVHPRRRLGDVRLQGRAGRRAADRRGDRDGRWCRSCIRPFSIERFANGRRSSARRPRRPSRTEVPVRAIRRRVTMAGDAVMDRRPQGAVDARALAERLTRRRGRLHPRAVGGHPRDAALQGRPGQRARRVPRRAAPGSRAPPRSAWARGRTATTWSGCPTWPRTRSCPGRRASPGSPATSSVDGEPWPYCSRTALRRAIERLAEAGYEMRVGVEAEHMLVTRDGPTARSPRTTRRARHARQALLRLQEPVGEHALPARADRVHGAARLGAVRVRPRGRHRPVRAQLEVRRRADDRRPLHVLQDDDQPGRATARGDRHPHAQAVLAR